MPIWPLCYESEAVLFKKFRPGHPAWHLKCSYGRIRDLGNRASPSSHMNTWKILRRKEWRGEISETEPARLTGLI